MLLNSFLLLLLFFHFLTFPLLNNKTLSQTYPSMNRPSFFVNLLVFLTLNILIDTEYVLTSAIPNEMIPTSSLTHTLVRRKFKCEKYVDCQVSTRPWQAI